MRRIGRSVRLAAVALALASLGVTAVPGESGASAPNASEVLWFASRSTGDAVAIVGSRRETFTAFPAQQVLAGNFAGPSSPGAFLYNPGAGPDALVTLHDDGEALTTSSVAMRVEGTYRPVVFDFDRNGVDDILWYGRGRAFDYLWLFQEDGAHTSTEVFIDGPYVPVPFVIDATATQVERAAILWYAAGPATDPLWIFNDQGGHLTSLKVTVRGDYIPVVGRFAKNAADQSADQVLWYDRSGLNTTLWRFTRGTNGSHTSSPTAPIGTGYRPSAGPVEGFNRDVVHWYKPGPGEERLWIWGDSSISSGTAGAINGTYPTVVDSRGHRPLDSVVLVGPGASAKSQQLAPESAPLLYEFTKIPDLPADPIGALGHLPQSA